MMRGEGPRSAGRGTVRSMVTIAAASGAVALAVWLWPASVHIASWPRAGPHRIAIFAPLVRLWTLLAAAALGTGLAALWGRRSAGRLERLAGAVAPLIILYLWTVPYWPWLPDRFPLLIAGAGPLRWMLGALAVGGVALRVAPSLGHSRRARGVGLLQREWARPMVFLASFVIYAGLGVPAVTSTGLGGDEPHYLVITHSLIADGDLAIENNHASGDYRRFFNGDLRPDYLQRGVDGAIYSIHAPGLSVWLIPGYLLGRGLGAVLTMCVLAALAATALYEIGRLMAGPLVAALTWGIAGFTVPFIPHAWAIYPEMAGAALVGWAVVWLLDPRSATSLVWVWRGFCLAWLPWLHTKFSVLLAGLVMWSVWRLGRDRRHAVALLVPIAVSGAAWLAFFYVIYGVWDPQAPYGGYTAQFVRMENIARSLLGQLFDQKFGLLVYAPIYGLAIPGLVAALTRPRWRVPVLVAAAVATAYILSSARLYMWWGGSSAPARFQVPVIPLVAPLLSLGLDGVVAAARARRLFIATAWTTAAGVSLLIAIGGSIAADRLLLFSEPHGVARMVALVQGSAPLTAALPTFTQEAWLEPLRLLGPWVVALGGALLAGVICARWGWDVVGVIGTMFFVAGLIAALLASSFGTPVRSASGTRGAMELLERFDPARLRAFDYETMRRLSPEEWLKEFTITIDREPSVPPDPLGRLTERLTLPAGEYEARVWFDGSERPRPGALQAAVGNGMLIARVEEPLPNPAVLRLPIPVAVPSLWIQLTDLATARVVRRVELRARDVVPAGERPQPLVRVVEAFPDRLNAYVGFTGEDAYPEGGVFWTRADARARLWLAPAGAATVVATLHVGPKPTTVSVRIGEWHDEVVFAAEETRTLRIPLPPSVARVPIEVQAHDFFVPAEVDPLSADTRRLGCQVRFVLE